MILWITVGLVAGLVVGFLLGLQWRGAETRRLGEEAAMARQDAARLQAVEARLDEAGRENAQLRERLGEATSARQSEAEKTQWVAQAEIRLREAFQSLASEALRGNSEQFSRVTREQVVMPLEKGIKVLDDQVRQLEVKREGAYRSLDEQLNHLRDAYQQLRTTSQGLATALTTSSGARGQWGEIQLRRLVDMAGMVSLVDFQEQGRTENAKPDMVIHLPNNCVLPVDAKTPMKTYLDATAAPDGPQRKAMLQAHVASVRTRIRELATKEYWKQFDLTPDFVIMFLPHDAFLGAALEGDPELLEFAFNQRVLPATPVTLLALLKTIAFAWQQQKMAENTREVAEHARELADRLAVFLVHLQKVGKGLDLAVRAYNDASGSMQSRVMPSARRMKELGAGGSDLPDVTPLATMPVLPVGEDDARK